MKKLLPILALILFTAGCYNNTPSPRAGKINITDLSEHYELGGEWEFYWKKFYLGEGFNSKEAVADKKYINYMTSWSNAVIDGWDVPDTGYATYRLTISLPPDQKDPLFLIIPYYAMPVNIFCNGRPVFSNGYVGTTPGTSRMQSFHPYITSASPENGKIELVIHASNFDLPRGGIKDVIIIGNRKNISRLADITISVEMILIGCLLIMCIYDLILYLVTKRNSVYIYFAIVCLSSAIYSTVSGTSLLSRLGMPWEQFVMIRYISWIIAVYFYFRFFSILFKQYNNRVISFFYTASTIIICAVILLTPFSIYNYLYYPITFLYLFSIVYYLTVSINEFIKRKKNSALLLLSFIILIAIICIERFFRLTIYQYNIVSPADLVLFCVLQSIILGRTINEDFSEKINLAAALQKSNSELTALNKHLQNIVAEKTDELKRQNQEISDQNRRIMKMNLNLEERVKASIENIRLKDDMLTINSRQASIGEMIGFIGHQWKQNIYAISLYIEGLKNILTQKGSIDINTARVPFDKIDSSILEMYSTLEDFNNFLKPGKEVEFFSIEGAVEDTILMMHDLILINSVRVIRDYRSRPSLIGFSNELKQVVLNIIKNSIDAFNEKERDNRVIEISIDSSDEMNHLRIRDNAGGVQTDNQQSIFEKFYTSKKKGTGLGLYIAKIIIEQRFNGKIELQNTGDGAVISISIPVFTEDTPI